LLWWMKRLIALRKKHKAFGRGTLQMLRPRNPKILAFVRRFGDEKILVVANLSRFVQHVELDLREFRGLVVEEMFSRGEFPPIGEQLYSLTLGRHGFYWSALNVARPGPRSHSAGGTSADLPQLRASNWEQLARNSAKQRLEGLLPDFLSRRRMAP